jgi:hypothetical protein
MLRLLLVAAAVAALLAASAWLVIDLRGPDLLRNELAVRGLQRVLQVDSAGIPALDQLQAGGITLRDPLTGAEVAHVERLRAELSDDGGLLPTSLRRLHGTGGRLSLSSDEAGLPIVRAISALIDGFASGGGSASSDEPGDTQPGPRGGALRIDFDDMLVTLSADGQESLPFPDCSARVTVQPGLVEVEVQAGGSGGSVVLRFDPRGLRQVSVRGLQVEPVCALFLPTDAAEISDELRPSGVLDLDLQFDPDHPEKTRADGTLREAGLAPGFLPFPVGKATLPFRYVDGQVTVTAARGTFPGGVAEGELTANADGYTLDITTNDALFRREYTQLIPGFDQIDWIKPEDGGNLDLRLRISQPTGGEMEVNGWAGVFIERMRVGLTGVLIEDVVGSVDVRGMEIEFHEFSGRCSDGVAQLRGTLNLSTNDVVGDALLQDVNIAKLDRSLELPGAENRKMAGWLQGSLHWEGRIGEPRLSHGSGQFSVRGGYLWRVPVLDAVLRSLTLSRPTDDRSDSLAVRFRNRGRTFYIDEASLVSDTLSLQGKGRISRAGVLDISITPIPMGGAVGDVLRYLQRQLVALDLRGTWNDPRVSVRPLKAVTGPIGDFFDWIGGWFSDDEAAPAPFDDEGPEPPISGAAPPGPP